MATSMKRLEFRQRFPLLRQGLFIFLNEKRLPKDQPEVNLGKVLSNALCDIPVQERPVRVPLMLAGAVEAHSSLTITRPEILFTPGFKLNVVPALLSLCRNRKISLFWPGAMLDGKLFYATPDSPEYYECDPRAMQDTYIIID